jgi:hypothetical protein
MNEFEVECTGDLFQDLIQIIAKSFVFCHQQVESIFFLGFKKFLRIDPALIQNIINCIICSEKEKSHSFVRG